MIALKRKKPTPHQRGRALLIMVFYQGPFERVMNHLWKVDTANELNHSPVKDGSPRDRLACVFDQLDYYWRRHYYTHSDITKRPNKRWKRTIP